jgi:hypothetical protein
MRKGVAAAEKEGQEGYQNGSYEPRWFMRDQHMNPAESVQAFIDCGAELALGHHYGTSNSPTSLSMRR